MVEACTEVHLQQPVIMMATLNAHIIFTDGQEVDFVFNEPMTLTMISPRLAKVVDEELQYNHVDGTRVFKVVMTWTPTQ